MISVNVGVAVIDTGIFKHSDFDNRIVAFIDYINKRKYAYDDSGHGTHVAGIIAGSGKASNGRYRGVAPKSNIIAVKVLDKKGNGRVENVLKSIDWIIKNSTKYNIRVVNISFGTTSRDDLETEKKLINKVNELWACGIVVVAAAGNNGPKADSITAPGRSESVITVGAFDDATFDGTNKNSNYYSGRGPIDSDIIKPDTVVTGSGIIACSNHPNSYSVKSGTSMSTPIVSGAIARLLQEHSELKPDEVKKWLHKCCKRLDIPQNQQGWGMLDVAKFVGDYRQ